MERDGFMVQRHGAQLFEGKIVASENYAHGVVAAVLMILMI
jgi:hypothetical protein